MSSLVQNKPLQGIHHNISDRNRDQNAASIYVTNSKYKFLLCYGGSGGGKSFYWLDVIVDRAIRAPGSRHAIFRLTRSSCEKTLFDKTLHEVLDRAWPGLKEQCEISLSNMTVTLPNGSKLFFDGLDENRMTKVLGDEFNTIWVNECNEDGLSYSQVSTLLSRLRARTETIDGKVLANKMFFDCNPRFYSDWEYKAFIQKINPEDGDALHNADQWVAFKMNAEANQANLHPDYIDSLKAGGAASRRRYVQGEWSDANNNALFTEKMFVDYRIPRALNITTPEEVRQLLLDQHDVSLERVTIAVDPAKSNNPKSDLTGITVQGLGSDGHAYVLADHSDRLSPNQVCELIQREFLAWNASRVVIESNAAGSWLESTMRGVWPNAPLKFIAATAQTGGKSDRAEPVAAQYERGVVHHVGTHKELEAQMCDWGSPASRRKSPDRMDAVVWGITELMNLANEKKIKPGATLIRQGNRLR
jgi:phage terminase large subunit-like protein